MPRDEAPGYEIEDAEARKETPKALLVEAPCWGEAQWIPQSQIHPDSEVFELGGKGTLVVTMWLAKQKGWV